MVLVKLLLAHIIGDFFLQRRRWITSKESKVLKSPFLYMHVMIHFVLILLLFWDLSIWPIALLIASTHYIIDAIKLTFQKKGTSFFWFSVDQIAHIVVLISIWYIFWGGFEIPFQIDNFIIVLTGIFLLTRPIAFAVEIFLGRWKLEDVMENESLPDIGMYIGMIERIFVYIAILIGHFQIIGFLLAAKAVFRFGDSKKSQDTKRSEHIFVGTIISFLSAILVGILTIKLLTLDL